MRTIAVVAVAVALTGCGSNSPAPPVKPATAPTSAAKVSPRGNTIKAPGETAYWDMKDGSGSLTFVVDHFEVTSGCSGGRPPAHGANLVFDLQVSTPASWPAAAGNIFHRVGYTVVGPDGVTVRDAWQGNTTSCDDYDAQWADPLAAGSKYQGKVVLDIPAGSTVLAFNPAQISVRGFEWKIPGI